MAATRDAVLRMVLYFDVFKHPLSLGELERFVAPGQRELVEQAAAELELLGLIAAEGRFRFRPGMQGFVARRGARAHHAERVWPAARRAADILGRLPFVEGALITGSLSKGSAEAGGDVDFLVLVRPGRVWTLKSMLQGGRRLLPEGLREHFCTNYLLDTDHLVIDDQNIFTAVELSTAIPMVGRGACLALLEANAWARQWVPGYDWAIERARNLPPDSPASPAVLGPVAGQMLEQRALVAWDYYWNHKYDWLPDGVRAKRFKRRQEIATNHLHDFQEFVLAEVAERQRQAGLHESVGTIGSARQSAAGGSPSAAGGGPNAATRPEAAR